MIEQSRVPTVEADVVAIAEGTTSQKFLELLAARDFERLTATLASDAQAQTPRERVSRGDRFG